MTYTQYHDDGEDQLNGVISTLSLGSPAVMKLRMKKKKTKGRKNLDLENGEHDEDNESSEKGNTKPILEIQLRHGDVVTMCDTRLQAFTEVIVLLFLTWIIILLANHNAAYCPACWSTTICDDLTLYQYPLLQQG